MLLLFWVIPTQWTFVYSSSGYWHQYAVGYQFDYVFDWTVLKYPQIGSSARPRVKPFKMTFFCDLFIFSVLLCWCYSVCLSFLQPSGRPSGAAGPSVERAETTGLFFSIRSSTLISGRYATLMDPPVIHSLSNCFFFLAGHEIRDRFSGAVEAFARRNASGSGHHAGRHKSIDDAGGSSKEAVSFFLKKKIRIVPASRYHVKQLLNAI